MASSLLAMAALLAWVWPGRLTGWQALAQAAACSGWLDSAQAAAQWDIDTVASLHASMQASPASWRHGVALWSHWGDRWVLTGWLALAGALAARRGQGRLALSVAAWSAAQGLLVWALKDIVQRPRPAGLLDAWVVLNGSSWPSGHGTASLVVYGLLAYLVRRIAPQHARSAAIAALGLALTVGLSRVLLGVHHPSDVLAAWLLGGLWLILAVNSLQAVGARVGCQGAGQ